LYNEFTIPYQKEREMKLTQPKVITWWIAVILGVIGLIAKLGVIPALEPYGFWLVLIGFILLMLGTLFKGL